MQEALTAGLESGVGTFVFRREDPGGTVDGQLLGSAPSPSHAASAAAALAAWPEWSLLGRFGSLFIEAGSCGKIVDAQGLQVCGMRGQGAGRQEDEF